MKKLVRCPRCLKGKMLGHSTKVDLLRVKEFICINCGHTVTNKQVFGLNIDERQAV